MVLKVAVTVFTTLLFCTLLTNDLIFFGHSKKSGEVDPEVRRLLGEVDPEVRRFARNTGGSVQQMISNSFLSTHGGAADQSRRG